MIKGHIKKNKFKRVLSFMMAVLMIAVLCVPQNVQAASPTATYKGGNAIADLLTNFQYFIEGDATLSNHTVGAVAIGGNLTSGNTIGDGAQSPSYASHIVNASIGTGNGYAASTRDFYYATSAGSLGTEFTPNAGYINIPSMFPAIEAESRGLVSGAKKVESEWNNEKWFEMITLDFNQNTVFEIPYSEVVDAKGINIVIDDINKLSSTAYTVNITGVNDNPVMFEGEAWRGNAGTYGVDVFVNGRQYAFLGDMGNAVHGIECNLSGMKLIWNFPDATGTVEWSAMGGHVVAPNAHVNVTSGRFQGGIIAASFEGTGESHYYPYNAIRLSANDIIIGKTYLDVDGKTSTTVEQAKFTLYTDADCITPVPGAEDIAVDSKTGYVIFDAEELNLHLSTTYYAKETYAPTGYEKNDTVYICEIGAGGLVTYCESGKSIYSSTSPICENVEITYAEDSIVGTLVVAVEDADTREKLADAEITVLDSNGDEIIASPKVTTESGVVSFTDLEEGRYTVSITEIPDGYKQPIEYTVQIDVRHTTYHTFELEKETEKITVYLKEVTAAGTPGDPVSGGWVSITDSNNNTITELVGTSGKVEFDKQPIDTYTVSLVQNPSGYSNYNDTSATIKVTTTDNITNNTHTFLLENSGISEPVPPSGSDVIVTVVEEGTTTTIEGAEVTITKPDNTTETKTTGTDGKVTFEDVPAGTSTVEVSKVPNGSGYVLPEDGKDIVVSDSDVEETLEVSKPAATGTLVVNVKDIYDDSTNTDTGVIIKVTDSAGNTVVYGDKDPVDDLIRVDDSMTIPNMVTGQCTVEITTVPDGYKTTASTVIVQKPVVVANQTVTADYVVIGTGDLEVIVKEETTGTPIPGATVTITDSEGTKYEDLKTDNDGSVELEDLPVGDYTVEVEEVPEDYKKPTDTITGTIEQNVEKEEVIEITPTGDLDVIVKEDGEDGKLIPDAEVILKDPTSGDPVVDENGDPIKGTTDSNGKVTFEDLPLGEYDVVVDSIPNDYEMPADPDKTVTVSKGENKEEFIVTEAKGNLLVTVLEENTTDVFINRVTVVVKDSDGNVVKTLETAKVDTNGQVKVEDLPVGTYTVEITKVPTDSGYVLPTDGTQKATVTIVKNNTAEEDFYLPVKPVELGDLVIVVVDKDGQKVAGATIVVTDTTGTDKTYTSATDKDIAIEDTTVGNYIVEITTPDGYKLVSTSESKYETEVTTAGAKVTFVLEASGDIKVTVKEDDGDVIPGADVVLKDPVTGEPVVDENGEPIKGTSDANGEVKFEDVPEGDYIVEIEKIPEGYDKPTDTDISVTVDKDKEANADFVLLLSGQITVIVTEKDAPNVLISGAKVELQDKDGNAVNDANGTPITGITNSAGKVVFSKLPDGEYKVVVTSVPSPFKTASDTEIGVEVKDGSKEEAKYQVYATGDLEITVVEDGSNPLVTIPNADVIVEDPEGNKATYTTDSNGVITLKDQIVGEYSITVDTDTIPDGYKIPSESLSSITATVKKAETTKEEFIIAATADLTITVVDKEDPTKPLEGADITVKDPYGNEQKFTTDADGKVTINDWAVGESTVTITKVPSTNVIPDPATSTTEVVKGSNTHVVEAPKISGEKGNLTIIVTDEITGAKIPGAVVEITDPSGNVTVAQTDSKGQIQKTDVPTGKYTVIITGVPDGYTTPTGDPTKVPVNVGENKVSIVIKKTVTSLPGNSSSDDDDDDDEDEDDYDSNKANSNDTIAKAPKTGDNLYIPIAIAMMVISVLGFAGVMVYRKKSENE